MALIIKGILVDDFNSLEISTVTGLNADEIMPQAARLTRNGAKVLEWRIDGFEALTDAGALRETLDMLGRFCDNTILIATIRTSSCGGRALVDAATLSDLYDEIAQSHSADLLDIETDIIDEDPQDLIKSLHDRGQLVVASAISGNSETFFDKMSEIEADAGRILETDEWKIFI